MIDFKKAIHLVSGRSAEGCLKEYFRINYPNDSIRTYTLYWHNLSEGPLNDFSSKEDFENYMSFWTTIEEFCQPYEEEDDEPHPDFSPDTEKDLSNIDIPLIIWHGSYTDDQLMLYRYCSILQNRDLYEINLADWPIPPAQEMRSNILPAREPEHIGEAFNFLKKIDEASKSFYASEWERLKKDRKNIRILQNGKVISVEEDYFDQNILNNCTSEFQKAAKVIGKIMSQPESSVGDYYIFYRIHVLIKKKLIEYEGDTSAMRLFSIRKVSSLEE